MEFEKKNGFYCKLLKTEEKKMVGQYLGDLASIDHGNGRRILK